MRTLCSGASTPTQGGAAVSDGTATAGLPRPQKKRKLVSVSDIPGLRTPAPRPVQPSRVGNAAAPSSGNGKTAAMMHPANGANKVSRGRLGSNQPKRVRTMAVRQAMFQSAEVPSSRAKSLVTICCRPLPRRALQRQAAAADSTEGEDGDSDLNDIVQALQQDQRRNMAARQAAGARVTRVEPVSMQPMRAAAQPLADTAGLQATGASGSCQAASQREDGGMAATWMSAMPTAHVHRHVAADEGHRHATAACEALQADAPELLETLKRHGIAEKLALLDDDSAAGRSELAGIVGRSALSQVQFRAHVRSCPVHPRVQLSCTSRQT